VREARAQHGSLLVVGVGIQSAGHATPAAVAAIRGADHVLYAVVDPWTVKWLAQLNPSTESLPYPLGDGARSDAYAEMARRILERVRQNQRVCAVFYGHPSFLADAARLAVGQARREGHSARILPAVSALDCLCADLEFDPLSQACLLAEAGEFLREERCFEASMALVLFQIAAIGNRSFYAVHGEDEIRRGLHRLAERLTSEFPAEHQVILYEATLLPTRPARQEKVALADLAGARVNDLTTLFVPALRKQRH